METTESENEASALSEFAKNIIEINHTLGILSAFSRDKPPADKIYLWIADTFNGLKLRIPPLRKTYSIKSAAWFNKETVVTHAKIHGRTWTDIVLKAAELTLISAAPFDFLPSNDELQRNPLHGCRFLADNGYTSTEVEPHLDIEFEKVSHLIDRAAANGAKPEKENLQLQKKVLPNYPGFNEAINLLRAMEKTTGQQSKVCREVCGGDAKAAATLRTYLQDHREQWHEDFR